VTVAAWPILALGERATPCQWSDQTVADFGELSLEALTPFVAFAVHVQTPQTSGQIVFVVNLPIDGEPAGREAQVLRQMLRHPGDLIALLLLLLAEDELAILDALSGRPRPAPPPPGRPSAVVACSKRWCAPWRATPPSCAPSSVSSDELPPRCSPLVRRHWPRSSRARQTTSRAISLIPPGFEQIWQPIWQTACELGVGGLQDDDHD